MDVRAREKPSIAVGKMDDPYTPQTDKVRPAFNPCWAGVAQNGLKVWPAINWGCCQSLKNYGSLSTPNY